MADDDKPSFSLETKVNILDYDEVTREAVKAFAQQLEAKEREEVAAAGMQRFANRTRVTTEKMQTGWMLHVIMRPNWMRVHEYGGTSEGRGKSGLLWIPLRGKRRAKTYVRGKRYLFRPKGKNVLMDPRTREVIYIGVPRVTVKPTLNMRQIAEMEVQNFGDFIAEYSKNA